MSFKEDCVNTLREVGLGSSGSVCLFREVLGFRVGSSDVPKFPNALTKSSMESVASVFRIMQFDKSLGVHA